MTDRRMIQAGIAGAVQFLVVMTILAATRADYDPLRHFISILSLGPGGWAQIGNFVVGGLLIAGLGLGLARRWRDGLGARWIPRLVTVAGLGLVGCGVFLPDPSLAYPPGTPDELITPLTWHGAIHLASATVIGLALSAAVLLAVRRGQTLGSRGLAAVSVGTATAAVGGCVAALVLAPTDPTQIVGLLERIGVYVGWAWLILVGALELRSP